MQDHFTKSFSTDTHDEENLAKELFNWAKFHTGLCSNCIAESKVQLPERLSKELEDSILRGQNLLDSFNEKILLHNKPLIPISGINRFNKQKEIMNNNNIIYPYKAELGTSCNLKNIPLPSRTYLKKSSSQ